MKLFYYKETSGNFGDDLNVWLWDRVLPGFFDDRDDELFVGIGTLLNHHLPEKPVKHIFGSGYGYGTPPKIDNKFVFHAVRGRKTASVLGINERYAITDSAILLRTVDYPKAQAKQYDYGYMPHHHSASFFSWEPVCNKLGINYIYPSKDVEHVMLEMSKCKAMLCEAMHGAIVADAMRIPWVPVSCFSHIDSFKWQDWLETLNLPYEPIHIPEVYGPVNASFTTKCKHSLKRALKAINIWSDSWDEAPPAKSKPSKIKVAVEAFEQLKNAKTFLSDESLCEELTAKYITLVDNVKQLKA